jgi:hypothetical protein
MRKLNKLMISVIGGLAFLMPNTALRAQTFPKVYVYGESDDADNISCSASHKSAVSAVQAALRSNGVDITYNQSDFPYMQAYVNVTAVKPADICAVSWSIRFKNNQFLFDEFAKKDIFASVVYCSNGGIITGSNSHIYSSILNNMRDATNECVSTYYETISK